MGKFERKLQASLLRRATIMAPSNFTAVKIKKEKITPIKPPRVDRLVEGALSRVKSEKKSPKPVKAVKQEIKRLDNLAGQYSANASAAPERDFKPKIKSEFRNPRHAPYYQPRRRTTPQHTGYDAKPAAAVQTELR